MDGNQGPEVAPAGYGDDGPSRAGSGAATIPGTAEAASAEVAGRLDAGPMGLGCPPTGSAGIIDRIRELEDW